MFYDILERKNAFLGYKHSKFKNWKNLHLCKGVYPQFYSKNGHFSNFFFQTIQGRKMSFTILWNEKKAFQAIKTRRSKGRKIDIFLKGLTHGFGPKMPISPTFFFQAIQARKMSFTIFYNEKIPFQPINTTSSKSEKIDIFFKGVYPWFWQKNGHFSTFVLFRQYGQGMCLLRYSTTKKRLSRL